MHRYLRAVLATIPCAEPVICSGGEGSDPHLGSHPHCRLPDARIFAVLPCLFHMRGALNRTRVQNVSVG
jgi:hypothetical protein